jgi:hypothetical protein
MQVLDNSIHPETRAEWRTWLDKNLARASNATRTVNDCFLLALIRCRQKNIGIREGMGFAPSQGGHPCTLS